MTKDEALQMCLEYIETDAHERKYVRHAIKAALEAKDEPVAWVCHGVLGKLDIDFEEADINKLPIGTLLYATPPAQPAPMPLTLGQKQRLWSSVGDKPTLKDRVNAYGLAIEAAHGIKGEA